jgi:hypothetical protein
VPERSVTFDEDSEFPIFTGEVKVVEKDLYMTPEPIVIEKPL